MAHNLETRASRFDSGEDLDSNVITSIHVDGSFSGGGRYVVRVNGWDVPLRGKPFKYFTILAFNRAKNVNGGWVRKTDIEPGENQIKYFYQLRAELKRGFVDCSEYVENNGLCSYRLSVDPRVITFNEEQLSSLDDHDVNSLFKTTE